jgi:hypothetical protein
VHLAPTFAFAFAFAFALAVADVDIAPRNFFQQELKGSHVTRLRPKIPSSQRRPE